MKSTSPSRHSKLMSEQQTETVSLGPPDPAGQPLPLARGTSLGRYVILDPVGSGGMGVVYAAYDPELDRKVALKLLRPDRAGEATRLRLLREAQAVARLSHPNVVAVFDVGTLDGQVFIAMELVQGRNLRQWLQEASRPWREVLAALLAAGRGLAAAHAAGLVHRDVKPENVLIGEDGRVRVADFGLARRTDGPEEPEVNAPPSPETSPLTVPLTEHGMAVGTPAYMAPEQLRGEPVDARSDQYGFCVTLWEALFGRRPPAGDDRRVPAWLRQALLRGLSDDPASRYPSMADLLVELGHDPAVARRRWLAAAGVVLAAGASLFAWERGSESRAQLCQGAEARLAGVWDADRKQAVRAAFRATGVPYAEKVWVLVERTLDGHTARWAALRREACEATRLRGEQSEDLLDRRMFCLDHRLQEVSALTGLFAHADRQVLDEAVTAASGLPSIDTCSDVDALTARVSPPSNPDLRSRVEAVRARVAEVRAWVDAGKQAEALPKARAAAELSRRLGYAPLEAEAFYQWAHLLDATGDSREAEAPMFDALVAAEAGGHQEVAARSAAQLAWIVGHQLARHAEGERWTRQALARVEGMHGRDGLRSELLKNQAALLGAEGKNREAIQVSLRALALAERGFGRENAQVAGTLSNLAIYHNESGQHEEALRFALRSLEIRRKVFPPDHPELAKSYNTLGNIYLDQKRLVEGGQAYRRAYEIFRKAYGDRHAMTAGTLANVATTLKDQGLYAEALKTNQQALAGAEDVYGPEHPLVSMILTNIAEIQMLQKRPAMALATFRRSLALDEKLLGPSHPNVAYSLIGISSTLLDLDRAGEAVPAARRALDLREAGGVDSSLINEARFILARALWESGRDPGGALRLARQARAGYAASEAGASFGQEVAAWLAQRAGE